MAELKRQIFFYAGCGAVVFCLVFFLFYWRSRVKSKKAKALESELADSKIREIIEEKSGDLSKKRTTEEIESQKIRESIEQYAVKSPEETARILKTWLSEAE